MTNSKMLSVIELLKEAIESSTTKRIRAITSREICNPITTSKRNSSQATTVQHQEAEVEEQQLVVNQTESRCLAMVEEEL